MRVHINHTNLERRSFSLALGLRSTDVARVCYCLESVRLLDKTSSIHLSLVVRSGAVNIDWNESQALWQTSWWAGRVRSCSSAAARWRQ